MFASIIPDIVRDFFAPAFSLIGATTLLGGGLALSAAAALPLLVPLLPILAPLALWIAPIARKAATYLLVIYAIYALGLFLGRREVRAEWKAQNEMVAIAYAERDAENYLQTKALADALDEMREREQTRRKQAKDALRKNLGPGNSRFTRDDIVRLREFDRDTVPRR